MKDGPAPPPLTSDGYGFLPANGRNLTTIFPEGRLDSRAYAARPDERRKMMVLEGIE